MRIPLPTVTLFIYLFIHYLFTYLFWSEGSDTLVSQRLNAGAMPIYVSTYKIAIYYLDKNMYK